MSQVLVAAGVAASHSHADKWKSAQPSVKRVLAATAAAAAAATAVTVVVGPEIGDDKRIRMKIAATDESLRQAMYMNCWGQS